MQIGCSRQGIVQEGKLNDIKLFISAIDSYASLLSELQKTCHVNMGTFGEGEQIEYNWRFSHTDVQVCLCLGEVLQEVC